MEENVYLPGNYSIQMLYAEILQSFNKLNVNDLSSKTNVGFNAVFVVFITNFSQNKKIGSKFPVSNYLTRYKAL